MGRVERRSVGRNGDHLSVSISFGELAVVVGVKTDKPMVAIARAREVLALELDALAVQIDNEDETM